mmetsp:Transcript_23385/g.20328  ORF Transcript_23385/g.20328 Transcript_23385/m.20328 type:complete len:115 (+) Transcript_23385:746-1090(+)
MRIPSLKKIYIRSINNFIDVSFYEVIADGFRKREEPLLVHVGCGIFGYYNERDDDEVEEYENDVEKTFKNLKEGQVFNVSSSFLVRKFKGGENKEEDIEEEEEEDYDEDEDYDE